MLNNGRMLIFGTKKSASRIAPASTLHIDGSFYPIFLKLVTVIGNIGGQALPFCYALLSDKSSKTYVELLENVAHVILSLFYVDVISISSMPSTVI